MERDHQYDGKYKKVLVGTAPGRFPIRTQTERLTPGPNVGIGDQILNAAIYQSYEPNDIRHINGEELKPPCEPRLYGGETVVGGPRPGYADKAGEMMPDDVTKDVILGNQYAKLNWVFVGPNTLLSNDVEQQKAAFNAGRPYDEQSQNWRLGDADEFGRSSTVEREETPKEARERMETDRHALEANNYHSGILHDAENHRWVTAMDVAIGQAVTMDDPVWHDLLILIADWKMDQRNYSRIKTNKAYARLSEEDKAFIKACSEYYENGTFPNDSFVSMTAPPLVTSELTLKAQEAQQRAISERQEAEMRIYQAQAGRALGNLGNARW